MVCGKDVKCERRTIEEEVLDRDEEERENGANIWANISYLINMFTQERELFIFYM